MKLVFQSKKAHVLDAGNKIRALSNNQTDQYWFPIGQQ